MIITIDGPPGSGKSTVAKILKKRMKFTLESVGMIFRNMAKEKKVSLSEFGKIAENDLTIDRELDKRTIELAKQSKDMILEGRLTGIMLFMNNIKAFKVYIDAPSTVRAKRVSGRDSISIDESKDAILKREQSENTRYMQLYGIKQGDTKFYDIIIDSSNMKPDEIAVKIEEECIKWQRKK